MPKEKAKPKKILRMQKRHRRGAAVDGSEWPDWRVQQWAAPKRGEPVFMSKLKRMLLTMIRQGKARADGTDSEGNPTLTFK